MKNKLFTLCFLFFAFGVGITNASANASIDWVFKKHGITLMQIWQVVV